MPDEPSLSDCFDEEKDEATYNFPLLRLVEPDERAATWVEALAVLMLRNKTDPSVTDDLVAALGWEAALAPLRPGRVSVRRGDFAEMIAAEAVEAFDGASVPVRKLRYQIDPNQTLPGSDVVAFILDDSGVLETLEFVEVKYRTSPARDIAVDAHEQLSEDRESGFATALSFLGLRLKETGNPLYDPFVDFLRARGVSESKHALVLACSSENWIDAILEDLDDLPALLPDLRVRTAPLREATDLIDAVYAQLTWVGVGDD